MGHSPIEAAFLASKEIGFAIVAMTITLVSVFLPIGLIDGFIGKLFIEFAWTLAFCVLFSGFVAITLTPMMASRMINKNVQPPLGFLVKFDQFIKLVQGKYLYYLDIALDHKKKFSLIIVLSLVVLVVSFVFVKKVFIPQEDDGFWQVFFTGLQGSSIKQSEKTVVEAEKILSSHEDIAGYLTIIGDGGSNSAFAFVPLKDWKERLKSQEAIKNMLNKQFQQIAGMSIFVNDPPSLVSSDARNAVEFIA